MVFMVNAQRWTKFVHGPCPLSLMFLLFISSFWIQSFPPPLGAWILTLYSPSQLILTFYLSIRQVTTRVSVPSAASPHFLLVAITEATLFMGLFPSMWLGRLLAHLMWRWRLFLEPLPHCTPVRVLFYSPFLLGALWGLPLMMCRSSLLSLGMPRTGSSSAASLGHLDFRYLSSTTILLGTDLGPYWKVGQDHKFSGPTVVKFF